MLVCVRDLYAVLAAARKAGMEPYEGSSWWERLRLAVRFRLRSGALRLRGGWLQIL